MVAAAPDAAALDEACEGFHRRFPKLSSKHVVTWPQALALLALSAALGWAIYAEPLLTWRLAYGATFALFAIAITWRLFAAAKLEPLKKQLYAPRDGVWPTYTLLCPLHREANVVFDLAAALKRIDYPGHALQILFLVEADDPDTIAAALGAASADTMEVVIIPAAAPRTKPKALNVGLALARGQFVAVYDAEDRPHPHQLRAALAAFDADDEDLVCVQAPLAVDNGAVSWLARQFAAEYAVQFHQVLPLLSLLKLPLPLGGTSNHFRTEALREAGGWDSYNVTEDAELGYRLARSRLRTGVIAPPTWEEAPVTYRAWLDQRTRWIKGHLQTWLTLMRDPIGAARAMGLRAFAAAHLVLGGGIVASFVHGPLALYLLFALVTPFDLLATQDKILALSGYSVAALATLSATAGSRDLTHLRAVLTMPFYWPLHSIAAFRAARDLLLRPHHWAKTAHGVSHRARFPVDAGSAAARADDAREAA